MVNLVATMSHLVNKGRCVTLNYFILRIKVKNRTVNL